MRNPVTWTRAALGRARSTRSRIRFALALALLALTGMAGATALPDDRWSEDELAVLADLRLTEGVAAAPDPSNRFADDPRAARLGQRFFFDPRFSANGQVSCATCHDPAKEFQDGRALARGVGTTNRRTMPIAGVAAAPFLFWDGRKDSLWSQALGPLESDVEHGGDRAQYAHLVASAYRAEYEAVFGALPDLSGVPAHAGPNATDDRWDAWMRLTDEQKDAVNRVFANVGKAIAAYERKLAPGPARFDRYVDAVLRGDERAARELLDADETAGLRLFIGKANCVQCHNGPRFTNDDFANTGVPEAPGLPPDRGRALGARELLQDEFNCKGRYSDAQPEQCRELEALQVDGAHHARAFKVPSLRNVAERAPYMHAGQFATLDAVVSHYDRAPRAPLGHSELTELALSPRERAQLVRFLHALSAPIAADESWLQPPVTR